RAAALDVWQWTLRLAPRAGLALQLAAVFRDAALAAAGASESRPLAKLRSLLSAAAVPTLTTRRACALLAPLDDRKDEERATLEDAAALSFFSRRSDRTLLTLGVEAMREEARLALHRLRPAARLRLLHIRLLPQVWRIVEETLRSEHGV
ncbi:MAG: hypothetical protein H5U40_08120, partial [Polyangiaceae bacterium]|nr:hypothetical protein [Polyangiaceae bacterium]